MATTEEQIHLAKWGNSKAARIPSKIIKQLNLADDQELTVRVQDDSIVLTPVKKRPSNIHELFADWKDDGKRDQELDWGKAEGHELPW
ncbi:AbrB/MazE/SpoVT family DNA-binding domain-containing protein [Levilactobacillus wangkuiensis]|uniref:AbrB/MazE/SpoVT family DNA-binding domain-containing protein n=1 Tax=Levilactobacillus wangkuiensis TaxID=2799566 RepID=UPI001941C213|nr:AbrB/MazE/SpoVT family DNA-binding domain-containing protein [Levilactobacillus wangkuiensis]